MLLYVWNASRGYRLRPWKSPYLRWRLETYYGIHAEEIAFRQFWSFVWQHRRDLVRFMAWAGRMRSAAVRR